jgi:hypothetical protein
MEENNMSDHLQSLKVVLQTLGLPTSGQVRLVADDDARVAILTGAFADARLAVQAGDVALTPEQAAALSALDRRLGTIRRPGGEPLCCELALRRSADWRQVRRLARAAILRFSWTLELPPRGTLAGSPCSH